MNTKNTASQPKVASIGEDAVMACPFCGGEGNIFGGHNGGVAAVNCESCDAYGPPARGKDAAISAWNRRAPAKNPAGLDRERPKLALWNESCGSGPNAHWYGDNLHEAGKAWRELMAKGERTMLTKYPGGVVANAEEMEAKFGDPKGSFTPDDGYMFDRWQEITVEVYGAPQQPLAPAADGLKLAAYRVTIPTTGRERLMKKSMAKVWDRQGFIVTPLYEHAAEGQVSAAAPEDLSKLTRYGWSEAYIGETSDLLEDAAGTYVKFSDVEALFRASEGQAQTSAASLETVLTEQEIDAVWNAMAGGPTGFLKTFGYQQFAYAIEDMVLDKFPFAIFDSATDLEARRQVTNALGLEGASKMSFSWGYLLGCIKDAAQSADKPTGEQQ